MSAANDNARPCPICKRLAAEPFKPFCSKRCADVDLNRWLSGVYAIPAEEADAGQPDESDSGYGSDGAGGDSGGDSGGDGGD